MTAPFSARIVARARLLGLDGSPLRGPHAGPAWFHSRLAVLRSDATALDLIDPTTGDFAHVPLSPPAGNLDLGACFTTERAGRPFLVAFGPAYVLTLRFIAPRAPQIRIVPWRSREVRAVVCLANRTVRLFGSTTTCDVALEPLLAELDDADVVTALPHALTTYDLANDTFAGASACADEVFCLAGESVGILAPGEAPRWSMIEGLTTAPLGLALEPMHRRRGYVITSEELLTLEFA